MGDLLTSIPVYKPQIKQQNTSAAVNTPAPVKREVIDITNPFPQTQKYSYIPAKPLSDPHTTPKGVTAHASKARLIHENFFQSIGNTVKSYADYAKYFYKAAFKGEGKDYSVGKINDLSIRAGSLGIAAVLATSKMFPFAKGMEFVGLGTWFASMAIWPHILGAPIKALYGVDINQKYIDSEGRKKYVFEDNGYRPMDIYRHVDVKGRPLSEEEYYKKYSNDYAYLDKVGDDLGVPRNIKNRNEATMNKMGQVAVQGKTLCMMTAGVMTPVVSSIAADALQTPLQNYLEKTRYEKAAAKLQKLDAKVDELLKYDRKDLNTVMDALNIKVDPAASQKLEALMTENEALSPKEFKKLQRFIDSTFFGTGYHDSLRTAMTRGMDMTEPRVLVSKELKDTIKQITTDAYREVLDRIPEKAKNLLPENLLNHTGLNDAQLNEMLSGVLYSDGLKEHQVNDILHHNSTYQLGFNAQNGLEQAISKKAVENFATTNGAYQELSAPQRNAMRQVTNEVKEVINKKVKAYFDTKRYFVIPKDRMRQIFNFAYTNNELQTRLKEFEKTSIQNISESITAINWQRVPKKYLQTLGFNKGEIALIATQDATTASKVLSNRLTELVQDSEKYKAALKEMAKYAETAISKEEKAVIQLIGTPNKKGTLLKVKELMEAVAVDNFGYDVKNVLSRHFNLRIAEVRRKIINTQDSYIRPVKVLDLFKDIKNEVKGILGANEAAYNALITAEKNKPVNEQVYYPFHKMSYAQAKESLETFLKDAILQKNDINNWTTKFETELPGSKQGMKHSFALVKQIADRIFGNLSADTVSALDNPSFANRCDKINSTMKARFLRIENQLFKGYTTEHNAFYSKIKEFANSGSEAQHKFLMDVLEERRFYLSPEDFDSCKKTLGEFLNKQYEKIPGYKLDPAIESLAQRLDFKESNRAISQMSGKNVTDFFTSAAQEIRARNKWSKLVYGLLGGTLAVSALTIALMGKKNYFNKDNYEYINTPQGADK